MMLVILKGQTHSTSTKIFSRYLRTTCAQIFTCIMHADEIFIKDTSQMKLRYDLFNNLTYADVLKLDVAARLATKC